jgi:site-specific DNA recombinase
MGKYLGTGAVLGYDVVDKKYVVNETEAKLVRRVFDLFLKHESCRKVAVALNAEGHRTKVTTTKAGVRRGGHEWNQKSVYSIVTDPKYAGFIAHKGKLYPGEHQAILEQRLFDKAKAVLNANQTFTHKHQLRRFALLRRMLHCGHCGNRVMPTWTTLHGREFRYYCCAQRVREGYDKCPLPSLPAGEIEPVVIDQLRALFRHPDVIARTYREVRKQGAKGQDQATLARLEDLRGRHEQTQKAIRALLNTGDAKSGFLADELKRLNSELKTLAMEMQELEQPGAGQVEPVELSRVTESLRALDPVWDVLIPEEQQRIIQLLVEKITVSRTGIEVRFRANGIEQIVQELQPQTSEVTTHA